MIAKPKPEASRRGPEDLARAHDQNTRILAKLREAGPRGITNSEMWALGAHAAHSRISDLRKRGHKITCQRERAGVFRYVLQQDSAASSHLAVEWKDRPRVTGLPLFDLAVRP